jgi:hypothetical protein
MLFLPELQCGADKRLSRNRWIPRAQPFQNALVLFDCGQQVGTDTAGSATQQCECK